MTDYVVTNGRIPAYPAKHYGARFVGTTATFCLDADLADIPAAVAAMPGVVVSTLTSSPIAVADTFFGMHVQKRINDGAVMSFKTVRSHDMQSGTGQWKYIETSDNVWNWSNLDDWVNAHYAAGRDLVFTLFGTPTWASLRPTEVGAFGSNYLGLSAEPSDMTKWSRFCTKVATRYLGKIKYYEVWNEPNLNNNGTTTSGSNFFFSGTFAKLSEMVRLANQAVKAVDATAKIICPAVQGWSATASQASESYFTGMMAASDGAVGTMADWVDIVAVHLYLPTGNRIGSLAGIVARVNAAKTTAGVSAMETWDTESAPIAPDAVDLSDHVVKTLMARHMIILAAKGVARSIYYQYDHGTMGVIDRPGIVAYREWLRTLLKSGDILSASVFADGRVAYNTSSGVTII